jgi:amidohydrolase
MAMDILNHIKQLSLEIHPQLIEWRRHLHQYPELSFQEHNTSKFISKALQTYEIPHTTGIAQTGIVALIEGNNPSSRCVALRADMDALPILEKNSFDFISKNKGVMHACGHDFHTSNLLGAAIILQAIRERFEGTIKLIFQPSEEKIPSGAPAMIDAGVLENPKVEAIFGMHVSPELPTGTFGFRGGQFMASADEIYLTVKGKGGHAAFPHTLIDPVLVAAQILVNLQQVISRRKPPFEAGVLSFGKLEALGATNIIPDEVKIAGTFRAMNEDFRLKSHTLIKQIAEETAQASGAFCEVNILIGYPFLHNDESLTEQSKQRAKVFNDHIQVLDVPPRMGAEDFAYYSQKVPACFIRIGTGNEDKGSTNGLHSPNFNVDDEALLHGAGLLAWLAINQ